MQTGLPEVGQSALFSVQSLLAYSSHLSFQRKPKFLFIYNATKPIKTAIEDVKDTAVIILAGKGAETHQKRGLVSEDYASDAVLARKYLKEYDERQGK